ncbi:KAP family NTPase [Acinetobacter baumannii]|nr:KAP family NTPase [Acinetobacter baumannii]
MTGPWGVGKTFFGKSL